VYSDARAEYTKQLCVFLVPAYFQFFIDLLERARRDVNQEQKRVLWQFQTYLNEIHDWNMEKVSQEIQRIHTNTGCDYLEDLLTAVFIAHTKVLTAIRLSSQQKKVEINIPKVDHFLFKVLCESSKLLWSSTYLFRDGIPSIEKQQNYRSIEGILNEGILQAVRSLVPVKSILKDFVNQDTSSEDTSRKESSAEAEEESDDEEVGGREPPPVPPVPPASVPAPPASVASLESVPTSVAPLEAIPASLEPVPAPVLVPATELPASAPASASAPPPVLPASTPSTVSETPPTIYLDGKPSVQFATFDAVFDSDHPADSEMVYDPKEGDSEDDVPDLEILEESGAPLSAGIDFDELHPQVSAIELDDYEEL